MKLSAVTTVTLAALLSTPLFSVLLLAQEGSAGKPQIELAPRAPHTKPKPPSNEGAKPVPSDENGSEAAASAAAAPGAGMGRPPLVIPATTATQKVRLRLVLPEPFEADDLELGMLTNAASTDLRITPR